MNQTSPSYITTKEVPSSTRAEIHLDRLDKNIALVQDHLGQVELVGVVKANGYGHGGVEISRVLEKRGVRQLSVATVREAVELRNGGITSDIIVFAPPLPDRIQAYHDWNLDAVVDSFETLQVINSFGEPLSCHIEVDTGMGRLGLNTHASEALIQAVDQSPSTFLSSIWTHFANADEPESDFTQIQFDRFMGLMKKMGGAPAPLHCAASAAAYSFPPSIDANLMAKARIGIALYGLLDLPAGRTPTGLQPILEFVSSVSSIKTVMAGTPISYGSRWITGRETRIATVAVGYADGIPTLLSNKGQVRIGGQLFPIVGKVCMDMFMVDLGPESDDSLPVRIGDHVTLYGMNSPTCFEVADLCSSITYVQVCGISNRVPRIYSSNWMT